MQMCIVHLIRTAARFVSWANCKDVTPVLRPLYTGEASHPAELEKLKPSTVTSTPL
jgi:transposase-like protein